MDNPEFKEGGMSQELVVRKGMAHGTLCDKSQRNTGGRGGCRGWVDMSRCVTPGCGLVARGYLVEYLTW